jgi:DNA-binding NarL/FixJ family response regulator
MTEKTADFSDHGFLVADDKAFLREMIQSMLVRCRARKIEYASNGAEAMKVLADVPETIDCVLCDWNMEPVDGLEVLRSIRAGRVHNTPRDLRVIMLTGHADEHVVRTALAMDANGYVVKPVSMIKLVDAVSRAFAKALNPKPAAAYETIGIVDLPGGTPATLAKRIPPWVLWSAMRRGEQRKWAERLEHIRRDAPKQPAHQKDKKRPVVNRQRMDLASIPVGRVLAEDIFSEEGHLLLAMGTVLTESLLGRLRELADDSAVKAQLMVGNFKD